MKLFRNDQGELFLVDSICNKVSNVIFLKLFISLLNHDVDVKEALNYNELETNEFNIGDSSPHMIAFIHSSINKIISMMNSNVTVTKPYINNFLNEFISKKNSFFLQYSDQGGYFI